MAEGILKRRALLAALALVTGAFVPALDAAAASLSAYYLFLADAPRGCEDCYVPLLVVRQSLEQTSASGQDTAIVLITTYERDSIWKVERDVPLAAAGVSVRERLVRLRGRRYRYQEIAPGEVLRLRPFGPSASGGPR